MIVSDRGCGDEFHRGAVQQFRIAFRAGAGDQGVCMKEIVPCDFSAGKISDFRIRFESTPEKRYLVVRYDFQHDSAPFSVLRCS